MNSKLNLGWAKMKYFYWPLAVISFEQNAVNNRKKVEHTSAYITGTTCLLVCTVLHTNNNNNNRFTQGHNSLTVKTQRWPTKMMQTNPFRPNLLVGTTLFNTL